MQCRTTKNCSGNRMADVSCKRAIYLDQLISLSNVSVVGLGASSLLYVKDPGLAKNISDKLKCIHPNLKAYLKKDVFTPERLHYTNNVRIGDIILAPDSGWTVLARNGSCRESWKGNHGYDNLVKDMRGIFYANGPAFKKGLVAQYFENVEIYNLIAEILKIKPAPNNGTYGRLSYLLKSNRPSSKLSVFKGDGNNFTFDCLFPKNLSEALEKCSMCVCPYCDRTISARLDEYRKHLNLTKSEVTSSLNTQFPWGIPEGGAGCGGCLLTQKYYAIGYSKNLHLPLWVGYKLTQKQLNVSVARRDCFRKDIRLKLNEMSNCSNYYRSGYDRGHLAPNGDFNFDTFAQQDTYVLSNMAPQHQYFNRHPGLWYTAEKYFRLWTQKYNVTYIISGSIFDMDRDGFRDKDNQTKRWLHNDVGGVPIPTHFYKIIAKCNESKTADYKIPGCGGALDVLGFVFPHNEEKDCKLYNIDKQMYNYVASIKDIEQLTGINFFPKLPTQMQAELESQLPNELWPIV